MRARAVILLALVSFACAREREGAANASLSPAQSESIDRLLGGSMKANAIPGLAVAVVRNGTLIKSVARGFADVGAQLPVQTSTPFQLASTTKSLSATAAMLMVGDGRLKLDDRAGDLLENLPAAWRNVTVRQLMSHTSGLPDIVRTPGQLDLIAETWDAAFPHIENAPMQAEPGTRWAYTQTNYVLLAKIIERRSGNAFEDFMQQRIFTPLGMKDTFYPSPAGSRRCATNYSRSPVVRALEFPPYVHAAGGLCSSLDDLVRWNAALDSGRLLKPELAHEMWTAARLNDGSVYRIDGKTIGYGLGWVVDDTPRHRATGHSGGNSTAFRRYIDDRFTVIVLHNGFLDPDGLITAIASIVQQPEGTTDESPQERLWNAAMSGDAKEIARALADGADIEGLDTRKSRNGRRALNWAAFNNHPEAIRLLLERGAAIDAANKTGFTALHHAAESGSREAADALLAAGANRTLQTTSGESAAAIARRKGHSAIATAIETR